MKKVAFFFGAGAERDGTEKSSLNLGIRSGYDYFKASMYLSKGLDGQEEALKGFFSSKYYGSKLSYYKSIIDANDSILKSFLILKSIQNKGFLYKNKEIICQLLLDAALKEITERYEGADEPLDIPLKHIAQDESQVNEIKNEFKNILIGTVKKYDDIQHDLLKELFVRNPKGEIEVDINVGMAGMLDSYFHTIINPNKYGPVKFFRVFNYYWACYFAILEDILKFLVKSGKEELQVYLKDEKLRYDKVLQDISELTKKLYRVQIDEVIPETSYYQLIAQKLKEYKEDIECVGTITTNYYKFCEVVSPNKVIYLNGQLKYFEYPELLEVRDMEREENGDDKLFFPFIFGQSLVKPIVNKIQTEAFYNFQERLLENKNNGADVLVVLGFNINEDDNHINAFLHDFVEQGKELIIVTDNEKYDVQRKLRCSPEKVKICKVEYGDNSLVVDRIFKTIIEKN